jgi:heme-degrading monooxygenase HmoA
MVIVAGHITVEPQQRESYLTGCVSVVERARGAAGCLDFAITADLIEPGRINIFERWESQSGHRNLPRQRPQRRPKRRNALAFGSRVRHRRRAALDRGRHSMNV